MAEMRDMNIKFIHKLQPNFICKILRNVMLNFGHAWPTACYCVQNSKW